MILMLYFSPLKTNNSVQLRTVLFLVKCYDKKWLSPYNLIINPLIKPQVANLQKQDAQATFQHKKLKYNLYHLGETKNLSNYIGKVKRKL